MNRERWKDLLDTPVELVHESVKEVDGHDTPYLCLYLPEKEAYILGYEDIGSHKPMMMNFIDDGFYNPRYEDLHPCLCRRSGELVARLRKSLDRSGSVYWRIHVVEFFNEVIEVLE